MARTRYLFTDNSFITAPLKPLVYNTPLTGGGANFSIPLFTQAGQKQLDVIAALMFRVRTWRASITFSNAVSLSSTWINGDGDTVNESYSWASSGGYIALPIEGNLPGRLGAGMSETRLAAIQTLVSSFFPSPEVPTNTVFGIGSGGASVVVTGASPSSLSGSIDVTHKTVFAGPMSFVFLGANGDGTVVNLNSPSGKLLTDGTIDWHTHGTFGANTETVITPDDPAWLPLSVTGLPGVDVSVGQPRLTPGNVGSMDIEVPDWRYKGSPSRIRFPISVDPSIIGSLSFMALGRLYTGSRSLSVAIKVTPDFTLARGLNRANPFSYTTQNAIWNETTGAALQSPLGGSLI